MFCLTTESIHARLSNSGLITEKNFKEFLLKYSLLIGLHIPKNRYQWTVQFEDVNFISNKVIYDSTTFETPGFP